MQVLPIRFEKDGFLYWQICRTDKAAIYEQRLTSTGQVWFEVWIIRISPAKVFQGKEFPQTERRPGDADWGKYGFTVYTVQDARKIYDRINGRGIMPTTRERGFPDLNLTPGF